MSKKKKKSKPGKPAKSKKQSAPFQPELASNRSRRKSDNQVAAESRTALAANVAWMLALMATLMAEAMGLVCRWYSTFVEPVELLTVLSGIMLFVAVLSGFITLVMIPVVYRVSETRPPFFIVQVAAIAGALPIVVVLLQFFLGR